MVAAGAGATAAGFPAGFVGAAGADLGVVVPLPLVTTTLLEICPPAAFSVFEELTELELNELNDDDSE